MPLSYGSLAHAYGNPGGFIQACPGLHQRVQGVLSGCSVVARQHFIQGGAQGCIMITDGFHKAVCAIH